MSSAIKGTRTKSWTRDWALWLVVGISLSYVVFLFPEPEYPPLNKDDGALFLTLGINIAELGRYTMDMMAASEYGLHATWPPVFPALLAIVIYFFGVSWVAIKLVMVICGLATLGILWRLWSQTLPGKLAVILTALNPYFFLYSHHTMAEVPYMLAVVLTLLLLDRSTTRSKLALAGIVGAVAFLTRGYAVVLLPVGVLFLMIQMNYSVMQRIQRAIWFGMPMLFAVIGWAGYTSFAISTGNVDGFTATFGSGTGLLSNLWDRTIVEHLQRWYWYEGRHAVVLMTPLIDREVIQSSSTLFAVSTFLLGLVALGWLRSFQQPLSSAVIWFPSCVAIMFLGGPGVRYWLPLLPFLFFYALLGAECFSQKARVARYIHPAFAISLIVVGAIGFASHLNEPDRLRYYDGYGIETRDMVLWARHNLPSDAIVITDSPADVYSASRRRAISLRNAFEAESLKMLRNSNSPLYMLCPSTPLAETHYISTHAICAEFIQKNEPIPVKQLTLMTLYKINY